MYLIVTRWLFCNFMVCVCVFGVASYCVIGSPENIKYLLAPVGNLANYQLAFSFDLV